MDKIKFDVFLPFYAFGTEKRTSPFFNILQDVVLECERLGYYSVLLDDHLMLKKTPILECWTTLSALSSVTERIRLGTMVTCNSFRNPALLAKMAATLDNISNGRLEFGIGAGVQKNEHIAYGFPFPSSKARIERMNEAVEIIKKMWKEEKASYNGKHYMIKDAVCEPKPMQKPHPPITIGGGGEKLTLRVTARHADRYDWGYLSSLELFKRKLKVLEKHCDAVGRSFHEIEKSCWPAGQIFIGENRKDLYKRVLQWLPKGVILEDFMRTSFVGTPEDCIKQIRQYVNLGVTHFMLFFGDLPDLRGLRLFAENVVRKID
ncbi:MAG: TIGR03560 family F420-dependent LLM class oxidoreductase [Candidatus Bathyarchaeota archaeon]|nr:TIGR03560 family F420-dependent LLM class oxidoreductase [Candidatus Bathyarchaeota archaeon]